MQALYLFQKTGHQMVARACVAVSLALGGAVQAQEAGALAGVPLWEVGLAGAALASPGYPAANQKSQRALVLPYFIYRGEWLRADRNGVGARLVRSDSWEVDVGFSGALPASSDDIDLRRGMPDLGTLVEFGPRLKMRLAQYETGERVMLELPLRAVLEFKGGVRQVGTTFEPKLAYEQAVGGWRVRSAVGLVLGDAQIQQYFYGVEPAYATAARPAYDARAGLVSSRLTFDAARRLNADVSVFGLVRYDMHAGAANRASPLFASESGTTLGVGLTWTLGRSSTRAGAGL